MFFLAWKQGRLALRAMGSARLGVVFRLALQRDVLSLLLLGRFSVEFRKANFGRRVVVRVACVKLRRKFQAEKIRANKNRRRKKRSVPRSADALFAWKLV